VLFLEIDPGGKGPSQKVIAVVGPPLPLVNGEIMSFFLDFPEKVRKIGMEDMVFGKNATQKVQLPREIGVRFHVVTPVSKEEMRCAGKRKEIFYHPFDTGLQAFFFPRKVSCHTIPKRHVERQDPGPIRGFPEKLAFLNGIRNPPPEGRVGNVTLFENLGHLSNMSKGIGKVPHCHPGPEVSTESVSKKKISNMRLATYQKLIRQNIPGTDEELASLDKFFEFSSLLRTNLQIILKDHRLSIQSKGMVLWTTGQNGEQVIHKLHQAKPKSIESLVPLPVPVGMGNDMEIHAVPPFFFSVDQVSVDQVPEQLQSRNECSQEE
jgi:hypothetical protein